MCVCVCVVCVCVCPVLCACTSIASDEDHGHNMYGNGCRVQSEHETAEDAFSLLFCNRRTSGNVSAPAGTVQECMLSVYRIDFKGF